MNYFFEKINKKLLLFLVSLIVVVISFKFIFYLPPLGGDEFLTVWPFRSIIFSEDFKIIIQDFGNNYFYEDHISPFFTLFASIIPFNLFDPISHVRILNLISFSFIVLFLFLIASKIFKNQITVLLFTLFFIANKALIYQHLSYYYSYTIVLLLQLINLYLLLKLIKNFNLINYLIYFSVSLIGTLTYENFFLYFFFESIFLCFFYLDNLEKKKILKLSLIGIKSITCITIYFILHKIKYGNLMLSYSKPQIFNISEFLNNSRMVTQNLVDDILFGIPYFFEHPVMQSFIVLIFILFFLFIVIKTIKLKKFNKEKKGFLFSIIFGYLGILYTGRYDSGLWTFLTILIYILFFSLIFEIYEISKKKKFSILILLIILSLNFFIPSKRVNFENEKKTNQHYFDLAAFELIEKKDFYNISIKDFSDLNIDFLYHPVRFMIGLEIFKSNDGLYYYRNEKSFWPINHQIIYQKNNLNNSTFIKTNIEEIQNINLFDSFWTKKIDNQNLNISFINNPNKKISSFEIINLKKILNLKKSEKIKIYLSNNFQTKNIKLLQGTNIYQTKIDKNGKIFFQIDNNNLDIKVFEDGTNITSQIKSIKFQSSKIFLDETLIILKKDYFEKNFIINNNHCRLIITNENFSDYRLDYYGIHKPEFTLNINFNKQTMDEKDLFSKFSNLTLKKKNIVVQNLKEKSNYICN